MSLLETVEAKVKEIFGTEVPDDLHDFFSQHLAVANLAAHVASATATAAADPITQAAEAAIGVPAEIRSLLADEVTRLNDYFQKIATVPPSAPASPATAPAK